MKKLLGHLADDLCGVERHLITEMTMSAAAKKLVQELSEGGSSATMLGPAQQDSLVDSLIAKVRADPLFAKTPLFAMNAQALMAFLRDEVAYVRSRLTVAQLGDYTDAQKFQRRGRGIALNELSRGVVLTAIRYYEEELNVRNVFDHEALVARGLGLLSTSKQGFSKFRAVLCDEVQDLSQLEIALLGRFSSPAGESLAAAENGIFLVGDGAQTIYRRGFTLRSAGIDVASRSISLSKNYRNTHEILKAAFGLVSQYEFADIDEDNITRPSEPDFAKRHGARPLIVKCSGLEEEAIAVAQSVHSLLAMGHVPAQICIVGPSARIRSSIQEALSSMKIVHTDLRQDVDYESDSVKISTIESAKGHEFASVFIMGLVDGILPAGNSHLDEISREASRFYVAMTRARENLTISYSPSPTHPASPFLLAIQNDCDESSFQQGAFSPTRA